MAAISSSIASAAAGAPPALLRSRPTERAASPYGPEITASAAARIPAGVASRASIVRPAPSSATRAAMIPCSGDCG